VLGSVCRFTGIVRGHYGDKIRVACSDGAFRYFPERDMHRVEDCPRRRA